MPDGATIPGIDVQSGADANSAITYTWTWDKDRLPPVLELDGAAGPRSKSIRASGSDELRNGAAVEKAMASLAEKSIVNPNATASAAPAAPKAGAPAPPPLPRRSGGRRGGSGRRRAGSRRCGACAPPLPRLRRSSRCRRP